MSWSFARHSGMAALTMAMCFTTGTQAHPHHWIDVFAEWQFDTKGLISAVKLRWLFDDYYSVLLADDATTTGKDLQVVLEKILSNIGRHHYFLRIERQGAEAALGVPEQARIGVQDHRIEVEFRLPMTVPLDPRQSDIVYRIAEPTYYFEMLHAEERPAIVLKDAPQCVDTTLSRQNRMRPWSPTRLRSASMRAAGMVSAFSSLKR